MAWLESLISKRRGVVHHSAFGFAQSGTLIVSEAGGWTLMVLVSSATLSTSLHDTQVAACWIVVTDNGRFAYTTNTHSNTISSYEVNTNGKITLLHAIGVSTDIVPIDMALARNSQFLYVVNSGSHTIQGFEVHSDGSLSWITTVKNIPNAADGVAAN